MKIRYTILLSALLALTSLSSSAVSAAPRPPNIVLFVVDDLGWRDLSCYGSSFYDTPNVDRLAASGMKFTNAYATCHVCSPSRASLLTGKYPARLQLTDWLSGRKNFPFQRLLNAELQQHLPLQEITIAEALKEHGYRTAHIGKWHLGEEPFGPLSQGFDIQAPRWNKGWPKLGYHAPFELEGLADQPGDYLTDRLTDVAEDFIETSGGKPFFLYLSHFAVHDPIQGPEALVSKYERKRELQPPADGPSFILEGNPDAEHPLTAAEIEVRAKQLAWSGFRVLPDRIVKIKQHQNNIQFAAMIESMDESLGRIVSKLDALGLSENTIIVFVSDNGGMSAANFGKPTRVIGKRQLDAAFSTSNLPLRGGKGWLYEGGIRVPLVIYQPKIQQTGYDCDVPNAVSAGDRRATLGMQQTGHSCDVPVITNDLYPTLLELAGLPLLPQQHVDGISLASLLRGETELQREALYWHFPHYSNHGMQSPGGAVRVGAYKLLEYFENDTVQLFNLREDLAEQHDLSQQQPEKVTELRTMLHAWRDQVSAQMMPANPDYRPTDKE